MTRYPTQSGYSDSLPASALWLFLHQSHYACEHTHTQSGRNVALRRCWPPCDYFGHKEVAVAAPNTLRPKWPPTILWVGDQLVTSW